MTNLLRKCYGVCLDKRKKVQNVHGIEEKALAKFLGSRLRTIGEAIYVCDYIGRKKQEWGYFTRIRRNVYMVVFHQPCSGQLVVDVPKGFVIEKAEFLEEKKDMKVAVTYQYHIGIPPETVNVPYVIRLTVADKNNKKKYSESLT